MNKKSETTKLITSHKPEMINSRFFVQYSVMDNGVDKPSYMLVIVDLVEEGFALKYFNSTEGVISMLKLLKAT